MGDCLIAAAFLSYAGPFLSNYRDELVEKTWLAQVRDETFTVVIIIIIITTTVWVYFTEFNFLTRNNKQRRSWYGVNLVLVTCFFVVVVVVVLWSSTKRRHFVL